MAFGDIVECPQNARFRCGIGIFPRASNCCGQVSTRFRVQDEELRCDLIDISGERGSKLAEILDMPVAWHGTSHHNRVVAPDDRTGTKCIDKPLGRFAGPPGRKDSTLDRLAISRDRVLEIKGVATVADVLGKCHERPWVLCPEDDPLNILACERDKEGSATYRILDPAVARIETIQEPSAIERRNVRFVASRNDHVLE